MSTAGHVDHGKSALVRALTGTDPDRLPEEKARGLTILPGYACYRGPSGVVLSFVDVPGHEPFLDHMIQGASGIDLVILVVAADDGVMPQTVEHLEVARLLGARGGVVVISKSDLVDAYRLEEVREQVREHLAGSPLEGAELLSFSALRPDGHGRFGDELVSALLDARARGGRRPQRGEPYLWADRTIRVAGRGVVVTGTLGRGRLRAGMSLVHHRTGKELRVRELQVHGERVEAAVGPSRVALNLAGQGVDAVHVGDLLAPREMGVLAETLWLGDFRCVRWLEDPPLFPVRGILHTGTTRAQAQVQCFDPSGLPDPDDPSPVRVKLDRPLALPPGAPYILRISSPVGGAGRTLGGGRLWLGGAPARRARPGKDGPALQDLVSDEPSRRAAAALSLHRPAGLPLEEVARLLDVEAEALAGDVELRDIAGEPWALAPGLAQRAKERILVEVAEHHASRPHDKGLALPELRERVGSLLSDGLCQAVVAEMESAGELVVEGARLMSPEHRPRLPSSLAGLGRAVSARLDAAGLEAPSFKELGRETRVSAKELSEVLAHLAGEGGIVRVSSDYYVSRASHDSFVAKVEAHLKESGVLRIADAREISGLSRKYLVPLLEDLDRRGVTKRRGTAERVRA